MLKHIQDDGDLSVFVSDAGGILFLCNKCKGKWTSEATPQAVAVKGKRAVQPAKVRLELGDALRSKPRLLTDMGIDKKSLPF